MTEDLDREIPAVCHNCKWGHWRQQGSENSNNFMFGPSECMAGIKPMNLYDSDYWDTREDDQ